MVMISNLVLIYPTHSAAVAARAQKAWTRPEPPRIRSLALALPAIAHTIHHVWIRPHHVCLPTAVDPRHLKQCHTRDIGFFWLGNEAAMLSAPDHTDPVNRAVRACYTYSFIKFK